MHITIRYLDPGNQKEPFKLFVRPTDTIALLKYQIFEKHSIPIYEQRMFPSIPGDTPPSDEEILESCGIQDGDVIKMYRMPMPFPMYGINEPFKIGIRPILGNVFLLEVRRSDTFGAVKQRIEDKIGYLVHTQDFGFGEDEDEKTLDHFRIIEPMTLTFQLKRRLGKADTKLLGARDESFTDAGDSDGDDGRPAVEAVSDKSDGVGIRRLQSGRGSPLYQVDS